MNGAPHTETLEKLAHGVIHRRPTAVARAISLVEEGGHRAQFLLDLLNSARGVSECIGITGPPGTGKSTLVNVLAMEMRRRKPDNPLGIVAVDPSSPFSGGAVLGDRMRMAELAEDAGVFIRSMASRGALGGLSEATEGGCDVLSAAGYPTIIVETVGVGQNEVDIASACETTIVVLNPESGDSVQAVKAGLMEIADIVVVNKADHPRTERFVNDITQGVELRAHEDGPFWQIPVLPTIATRGEGIGELAEALDQHHSFLKANGLFEERRRDRLAKRILGLSFALLRHQARDSVEIAEAVTTGALRVAAGECTISRASHELLNLLKKLS